MRRPGSSGSCRRHSAPRWSNRHQRSDDPVDRANALPPVQNLRPGIVISNPIERCAAGIDELVHHAPLRAIARKVLGGTRERAELLGASRWQGGINYGHLLATCTDDLVRGALASRGAPIALVTGPIMVSTIRGTKEHLQTDK
jgi:hypothetical protein